MKAFLITAAILLRAMNQACAADFPGEIVVGDWHGKVLSYNDAKNLDKNPQSCVMVNHSPSKEKPIPALLRQGYPVLIARHQEEVDGYERGRRLCQELGFQDISRSYGISAEERNLTGQQAWVLKLNSGLWGLIELQPEDVVFMSVTCATTEDAGICNAGDWEDPKSLPNFFFRWDEIIWNATAP